MKNKFFSIQIVAGSNSIKIKDFENRSFAQ